MNINTYLGRYILSPFKVVADTNVSVTVAPSSIDGQSLTAGDRVFLSAQSTASQNGGWVFASAGAAMTRATDLAVGVTIKSGTVFICNAGTTYGDKLIVIYAASDIPIIIGTTSFSVSAISGGNSFSDSLFNIYDNVDNTKIAAFQSSTIATGTTRTFTFPDSSGTIALVASTEVPLTFSTGLTRTINTITADLSTGVAGGQTATGGIAASENLTLRSTSHATKGFTYLGSTTTVAVDETNKRIGFGIASPTATAHAKGSGATSATYSFKSGDSGSNIYFSVRDNGEVNSKSGYWVNETKMLFFGAASTSNIFCGASCGNDTQTGNNNTGFGTNNLNLLTTGLQNTAFGSSAVYVVTTGINNTGIGFEALKLTTNSENIGLGSSAGVYNTSGANNIFIGNSSGISSVTSGNNIFLGHSTTVSADTWTSSVAIGKLAVISASNQVVFGSPTNQLNDFYFGQGAVPSTTLYAISFNTTSIPSGTSNASASAGSITWNGAQGTGTGIGGSFIWKVAVAGSTGSSVNSLATKMTLSGTTGSLNFAGSTTSGAQINLATGSAPTSPVDGDIWREDNTNTGLKIRINGVTKTITVS